MKKTRHLILTILLTFFVSNAVLAQTTFLSSLKAVLLVGPIDGDTGAWTMQEIEHMEIAAAELESFGVSVHRFYTPNNDWDQIKDAADGAHFLLYRGHGVYWSPMPTPTVGGFCLSENFVSSEDIRRDLHLAPNAIAMLYGCFTAGSSGNDTQSVTSAEAQRRVAEYSDPFFDIGAAGYYANWFGDAFQMFVHSLFQGNTLGETYEAYFDFNSSTVERHTHPNHPTAAMWLDKDYWYDPLPQYNHAFVGQPNATLADLFQHSSADFDKDGDVDGNDFLVWQSAFNINANGDADTDGDTDDDDFLIWQTHFGSSTGSNSFSTTVPEPASILLLAATLAWQLLRKFADAGGGQAKVTLQ